MIPLNDIRKAVIGRLRKETDVLNITGEELKNVEYPLFHVQLVPLSVKTRAAGFLCERKILIKITYQKEWRSANTDLYSMLDKLDTLFLPYLSVADRNLAISGAEGSIADGVGHYQFYLDFTDTTEQKEEEAELFQSLNIDL